MTATVGTGVGEAVASTVAAGVGVCVTVALGAGVVVTAVSSGMAGSVGSLGAGSRSHPTKAPAISATERAAIATHEFAPVNLICISFPSVDVVLLFETRQRQRR